VKFATPSEVLAANKPVSPLEVIYPVSWNDEERDTSSLLGNCMQRDTFNRLYDEKIVGLFWHAATVVSSKTGTVCRQVTISVS
jgi:alpha-amylase/alpha-mannosidase (GH57 family)